MSTVLASPGTTINNGGRKIVKASNGYLFSLIKYGADNRLMRSTDDGATWSNIRTINDSDSVNAALAIKGNYIHVIYYFNTNYVLTHLRADGAQATPVFSTNTIETDGTRGKNINSLDGVSIDIDGNGTIHVAYAIKYANENSFNITYAKSSTSGSTWVYENPVYENTTGTNYTRPTTKCKADNNPFVSYRLKVDGVTDEIRWGSFVNSSWDWNNTLINNGFDQESPSATIDSEGYIHVVWRGKDSTDSTVFNIRYAKATNTDATGFLAPEKLTEGDLYNNGEPSIAINKNSDKVHILWHGYTFFEPSVTNVLQINKIKGAAWSSITALTDNDTNNAWYVHTAEQMDGYLLYIYKDDEASAEIYDTLFSNTVPSKPTLATAASFDATTARKFNWTFNDVDTNDYQSAYQVQFINGGTGATEHDTGKVSSTDNFYSMPADTLLNGNLYQWKVKTWDAADAAGAWSDLGAFNTSAKPTATITTPANDGETVQTANYTVAWDYIDPESTLQEYYQVRVTNEYGDTVWNSGKVQSDAASVLIGATLENDKTYTIRVIVWDGTDVQSDVVTKTINVQYIPPEPPILTFDIQDGRGAITCFIENPDPTGGQPTVTDFEVYRKILGTFDWERLAANEMVDRTTYFLGLSMISEGDFAFTDYSPRHELIYEYKIRSLGDNGTYTDSIIRTASVKVSNAQLALTSNYEKWVQVAKGSARDKNYSVGRVLNEFSGRSSLMADFNEIDNTEVSLSFLVDEKEKLDTLIELLKSRDTLLYRDNHEAKEFVTIDNVAVRDNKAGYWEISVSATKVYFDEVV